jgi:hypothetical protein
MYFSVAPGEHRLCTSQQSSLKSRRDNNASAITFKAESGKVYYFRTQPSPTSLAESTTTGVPNGRPQAFCNDSIRAARQSRNPRPATWRFVYCVRSDAMDDPKQLIGRFVEELWNERRLAVAAAIFARDCVTHQQRSGVPVDAVPRGPEAIKEHVAGWITGLPASRSALQHRTDVL